MGFFRAAHPIAQGIAGLVDACRRGDELNAQFFLASGDPALPPVGLSPLLSCSFFPQAASPAEVFRNLLSICQCQRVIRGTNPDLRDPRTGAARIAGCFREAVEFCMKACGSPAAFRPDRYIYDIINLMNALVPVFSEQSGPLRGRIRTGGST